MNKVQELQERLARPLQAILLSVSTGHLGNLNFLSDEDIFNRIAHEIDDMRGFVMHKPEIEPVKIQVREK